jgi:hypothetical protein
MGESSRCRPKQNLHTHGGLGHHILCTEKWRPGDVTLMRSDLTGVGMAIARHHARDASKSVLGLHLQRRGHPARGWRSVSGLRTAAESSARKRRHGSQFFQCSDQQLTASTVEARIRIRHDNKENISKRHFCQDVH